MLKKQIVYVVCLLVSACILFLSVEGFASLLNVFHSAQQTSRTVLAERQHTQYDPDLGWVNQESLKIPNMYGPSIGFSTNSQGFRNVQEFSKEVPSGKIRIICSGDSFTLGYGVNDDETWCERFKTLDRRITKRERLETVNMGQGGYGIDQMYLWYLRDGIKLDHQLQLFAFIMTDFVRMQSDHFEKYGKPLLNIEEGELRLTHVPVPKRPYQTDWFAKWNTTLGQLKSVAFSKQIFHFVTQKDSYELALSDGQTLEIAVKLFEDLDRVNREKGSVLILIYLPMAADYRQKQGNHFWATLSDELNELQIRVLDLREDFNRLPVDQHQDLFIKTGQIPYPYANGHYSVKGNIFVASLIYRALIESPETRRALGLHIPNRNKTSD